MENVRRHVKTALELTIIAKSVDYAIHVNCIENMLYKLRIVIFILMRFVTLTLKDTYAPIITVISPINGKILIQAILDKTLKVIPVYF